MFLLTEASKSKCFHHHQLFLGRPPPQPSPWHSGVSGQGGQERFCLNPNPDKSGHWNNTGLQPHLTVRVTSSLLWSKRLSPVLWSLPLSRAHICLGSWGGWQWEEGLCSLPITSLFPAPLLNWDVKPVSSARAFWTSVQKEATLWEPQLPGRGPNPGDWPPPELSQL